MRLSIFTAIGIVISLENGIGKTPFLGWNTYNRFGCYELNEEIVRSQADKIIEYGLNKLGYKYVNVDDCWLTDKRDVNGNMITDFERFPNGMKALGDYIHSKGLKFGIYSSAGTHTCAGRSGSLWHESKDAAQFAYFGVDLLKYDNCYNQGLDSVEDSVKRYSTMRDALQQQNRTILYSMCQWGQVQPWDWAEDIANTFRSTGDIGDRFGGEHPNCPCSTTNCTQFGGDCSILNILDKQVNITQFNKPGFFSDMDMMELGNGGLSLEESKSHFFLWAALKSPLIIGADLRTMSDADLSILKLKEVIKVNQDPLGVSASLIYRFANKYDIWAGPLIDGAAVVILLNRSLQSLKIKFSVHLIHKWLRCNGNKFVAKDLFTLKSTRTGNWYESAHIKSHDSVILKFLCPNSKDMNLNFQNQK